MENKNIRRIRNYNLKQTIIRFIKSQRLRWAAHCNQNGHDKNFLKKLTEWEPCSSRLEGRPRQRWLEQVEEDLKNMEVRN